MAFKIKILGIFILILKMLVVDICYGKEEFNINFIRKKELGEDFFYHPSIDVVSKVSTHSVEGKNDIFFFNNKTGEAVLDRISMILLDRIGKYSLDRFFYAFKSTRNLGVLEDLKSIVEYYDRIFGKINTNVLLSYGGTGFYRSDYEAVVLFFETIKNFYFSNYKGKDFDIVLEIVRKNVFNNFYWIVFNNSKRFSYQGDSLAGLKDLHYKINLLRQEKVKMKEFIESLNKGDFFYFLDLRYVELKYFVEKVKEIIKNPELVSSFLEKLDWERVFNIFYKIKVRTGYLNFREKNPYTSRPQQAVSGWNDLMDISTRSNRVLYWTDLFLGNGDKIYDSRIFKNIISEEVNDYIQKEYKSMVWVLMEAHKMFCSDFFDDLQ